MSSAVRKTTKDKKANNTLLEESNLLSFFDEKNNFVVHFLEGQKLIHDLAIINDFRQKGLIYIRDCVLAFQPMIAFLKPGEGFGLYIDSEIPNFRFKIETNVSGTMRTLLLPEDLLEIPEKITGVCRLSKLYTTGNKPYTSVIKLNETPFKELSNLILNESYQICGKVIVSDQADQSILLIRLPSINYDKEQLDTRLSIDDYCKLHDKSFKKIFSNAFSNEDRIIKSFERLNLTFLKSKQVKFRCACSRERMLLGLANIIDHAELFEPNNSTVETKCDYCKTYYQFSKEEIIKKRVN